MKNWLKFVIGFGCCLLLRLVPFRAPNIEPILATQMPFSKVYGAIFGFIFGFFSIIIYDLITVHFGLWSLITGMIYGLLGIIATSYFRKKENPSRWDYALFAVFGTLLYDALTGLTIGPLFFHQSFINALTGQIPFTFLHLLGNVSFSVILSPAIYNFISRNKKLEAESIINIFSPKTI